MKEYLNILEVSVNMIMRNFGLPGRIIITQHIVSSTAVFPIKGIDTTAHWQVLVDQSFETTVLVKDSYKTPTSEWNNPDLYPKILENVLCNFTTCLMEAIYIKKKELDGI
jgi:hypothetical protein